MTGQRHPHAQVHDDKPAGMLGDELRLMFDWYKSMVDESTGRLLYLYDPENNVTIGDGKLIRDIAAIWDVEVLSAFLGRDDLRPLLRRSLDYFRRLIVERDDTGSGGRRRKSFGMIGLISLGAKQTGERSARKSACCVRRGGDWKRGTVEMV